MAGGVPYQQIVFSFETGNLFVKQPMVSGQPRQKNQGDGFGAAVTIHPVMNLAAGRFVELFLHGCHLLRFLLSLYSNPGESTASWSSMDSPQPLFALTKISAGIWTPCTDSGAFLWAGRFLCGKCRLCGLPRPEEGTGRLEDHGQGIYRGLRLRPSIGKQTFPPCVGAEKSFALCRPAYTGGREYPQAVTADSGKTRQLDHHLTTSSSQPVPCIVFYVPTSFYNHQKQRRKLCTLHNFRRCIMLFACASQFSDQTTTFNWTMDN